MTTPAGITLLDGGMGQELIRRWGRPATPLWSTAMLLEAPELVTQLHGDFIAAGAEVIIVNAYAVTPPRLAREGLEERFQELQTIALEAAQEARDQGGEGVRIAGCLPPLVASYRPDLARPEDAALEDYRRIVAAQAHGVDFFLCETLPSIAEARVATTAARESGKPVWTALTVDDADGTRLRSGESLVAGFEAAREAGAEAVLVNCSTPEATAVAMATVAPQGGRFGAYANGFVSVAPLQPGGTVDALEARRDLDPEAYAEAAMAWVATGAVIVGGCCEVGPAHIRALGRRLGRG
ncbi:MAG: homocysteine S-methyltransferase family protein [Candidatus Competibacterales bacterium]